MTRSQPELSPYDTGARCEPKLWQPYREAVAAAMRSGNADDIGNVDFTDDADRTVVTVHVSRSDDGMFTVHLIAGVRGRSDPCRAPRREGQGHQRSQHWATGVKRRHSQDHERPASGMGAGPLALDSSCGGYRVTRRGDSNDC